MRQQDPARKLVNMNKPYTSENLKKIVVIIHVHDSYSLVYFFVKFGIQSYELKTNDRETQGNFILLLLGT